MDFGQLQADLARAYRASGLRHRSRDLAWLYRDAFGAPARIARVERDGLPIAQGVALPNRIAGHRAAQLVDLMVAPEERGGEAVALIYETLSRRIADEGFEVIYTVGNPSALRWFERTFGSPRTHTLTLEARLVRPRRIAPEPPDDPRYGSTIRGYRAHSGTIARPLAPGCSLVMRGRPERAATFARPVVIADARAAVSGIPLRRRAIDVTYRAPHGFDPRAFTLRDLDWL